MKASELRIGNYVFDDEGILSKINGFQPYGHSIRCDEKEGCELLIDLYPQDGTVKKGYETDINLCKPIPLTEEWLIRFGYNLNNCYYLKDDSDIEFFKSNGKIFCEFYGNWFSNIEYVHDLQNLHFAIYKEELKLKKQ